jgi:hypothetical protein
VRAELEPDAKPGTAEIHLVLRYQACNDQRCLAAKAIQLKLPIEVAAAETSEEKPNP